MSAVFGREPSRPLPSDAERDRDEPIEATVVDVREGDDADAQDTGPDPDLSTEGTEPEPEPEGTGSEAQPPGDMAEPEREPEPGSAAEPVTGPEPVAGEPEAGKPVAEAEPAPEPVAGEPVAVPPTGSESTEAELVVGELEAEPVAGAEPEPVAAGPDDAWDRRWDDLQATFVDDPRGAVDGAAALLSEALAEATPGDAGTENLRVAFRRYRAAFRDLHPAA